MFLIGDIGGTKTNLALFSLENKKPKLEQQASFKSVNYPSLETVVHKFLAETDCQISKAVFGVAGPVVNRQSQVTNLPWVIAEESLKQTLQISKVKLLNDLEATAYAVPHLPPHELLLLNGGQIEPMAHGHKAIIAPGTGLGEAALVYNDGSYIVIPSEGGHASFAPTTLLQIGLLRHMLRNFDHVSFERVCSGSMGIPNIYGYLLEQRVADSNPDVAEAIRQADDATPVIADAALEGRCELCISTLNIFVSILGSEASNLAIKVMATGGVYLGGGIPPRIVEKLKDGTFMAAFVNKGRFTTMLSRMPVYVILNDKTALLGAAYHAIH